jgi:hypothetical protein
LRLGDRGFGFLVLLYIAAGPRKPAQRPWLAEGISRSTWYRRRKQAREREALVVESARRHALLSRAEAFTRQLQAELAEAARCHWLMAAIIVEQAAMTGGTGYP